MGEELGSVTYGGRTGCCSSLCLHTPFSPYVAPRFPHMSGINSLFCLLHSTGTQANLGSLRNHLVCCAAYRRLACANPSTKSVSASCSLLGAQYSSGILKRYSSDCRYPIARPGVELGRRRLWRSSSVVSSKSPERSILPHRRSIRRQRGSRDAVRKKQRRSRERRRVSRESTSGVAPLLGTTLLGTPPPGAVRPPCVCIATTSARCNRYQSFRESWGGGWEGWSGEGGQGGRGLKGGKWRGSRVIHLGSV